MNASPSLDAGLHRVLARAYPDAQPDAQPVPAGAVPGAALGVYAAGELIASAALGHARLEGAGAPAPIGPDTPFEIASVSKQIGACAILALARDGVVDLDGDLREQVPELRVPGITLRHCLQHTSGLPDYLLLAEIAGIDSDSLCGHDAFLAGIGLLEGTDFPPGTAIAYSNTGYVLAAIGAERAAGRPWSRLLEERVFAPLGMAASSVGLYVDRSRPDVALSYAPTADGFAVEALRPGALPSGSRHTVGDGQVVTTLADFAAWHGFLHDGRVLGADLRAQLLRRTVLTGGRSASYGLGIRHERVGGTEGFGHSGSMWGFRSFSLTVPREGLGVAVFANRADTDPGDLAWRALRRAAAPEPAPWGVWVSAEALRATHVDPRADGGIELDDGARTQAFRPRTASSWVGQDELEAVELGAAGLVTVDAMGRRVAHRRAEEAPVPDPGAVLGGYAMRFPPARLDVREGGSGLELCRSDRDPLPLRYVGTVDGRLLYRFPGGLVAVEPGPRPRLTLGTESAVLRNLPRVDDGLLS